MQITKTQKIVAASVAVIAVITGGSVAAYKASVHEQICLSYENQAKNQVEGAIKVLSEMNDALGEISTNPFSAFAYMPLIPQWKEKADKFTQDGNDWRYAYSKTCGVERQDKFLATPDMKEKNARFDAFKSAVSSRSF